MLTCNILKIVVDILTPYIPGEQIERIVEEVILMRGTRDVNGTLYITNYQLIFVPTVSISICVTFVGRK